MILTSLLLSKFIGKWMKDKQEILTLNSVPSLQYSFTKFKLKTSSLKSLQILGY